MIWIEIIYKVVYFKIIVMHKSVQNLLNIEKDIKSTLTNTNLPPKIIAVSKTFNLSKIMPLIEHGHVHYGENKVQEAIEKWTDIKNKKNEINLHMVGKLQSNKVKYAVKIFDYIHSLDSLKVAKKISDEQVKYKKKPKLFIQINIGSEVQKSGINKNDLTDFLNSCKTLELDIVGLMCLPPHDENSEKYFSEMNTLSKQYQFLESSMGMSNDYLKAIEYNSTFLRIGTKIFGERV